MKRRKHPNDRKDGKTPRMCGFGGHRCEYCLSLIRNKKRRLAPLREIREYLVSA